MGDVARTQARPVDWVTRIAPDPDLPVPVPVSAPELLQQATQRVSPAAVAWAAQVGAEAAAHIEDELPLFGGSDRQREILRKGTESATLSALLMFAQGPGEPPPLTDDAGGAILEYVRQDVTLDQLLSGIRLGHAHMSAAFLAAAEALAVEPGRTATLREISARLFDHIDRFSRMAAELFTAERERWLTSESTARMRAVKDLLAGEPVSSAAATTIGYDLEQRHVAVVASCSGTTSAADSTQLQRLAHEVLRRLGGERQLIVPVETGRVWAWAGSAPYRRPRSSGLDELPLPAGTSVAIGAPGVGLHGFRRSHLQALDVLRVQELAEQPVRLARYEDEELVALLSVNLAGARELVLRVLGPLAADTAASSDLRTTLKAYLDEHGSPVAAAAALHVARNTVSARVQRAAELLHRDISRDCLDIHVALELVERLGGAVLENDAS